MADNDNICGLEEEFEDDFEEDPKRTLKSYL